MTQAAKPKTWPLGSSFAAMFARFDTDANGSIDLHEFIALYALY